MGPNPANEDRILFINDIEYENPVTANVDSGALQNFNLSTGSQLLPYGQQNRFGSATTAEESDAGNSSDLSTEEAVLLSSAPQYWFHDCVHGFSIDTEVNDTDCDDSFTDEAGSPSSRYVIERQRNVPNRPAPTTLAAMDVVIGDSDGSSDAGKLVPANDADSEAVLTML